MAIEISASESVLEAEFSLLEEEFFGERVEEKEPDNVDDSSSDNGTV